MDNQNDLFRIIIKYNPYREYVGKWTPKRLHKTFHEIYEDPFRPLVYMEIGKLSIDTICDALWGEMSYNPMRFGTKNPFEFDGIQNIKKFCKKYKQSNNPDDVMPKIASELGYFLYFIGNANPEFNATGKIETNQILINCDRNRKSGYGYKALACLTKCIHLIATQNLNDYRKKDYRQKIQEMIIARHPNMKRSDKYINIIKIENTQKQTDDLLTAIIDKNSEIMDITTLIKTLGEYEPPVDTSKERAALSKQNQELQILEEKYARTKEQRDNMLAYQRYYER